MCRVNVDGVIHATRAVVGSMRARRYGRIINMASIAAIGTALAGNAFYAATKAEVVILTAALCPGVGPARHHCERRSARLCPHRPDAAWSWRSGLAGDGGTLRRTSDDGSHR